MSTYRAGIYVRISQDRKGAGLGVQRQQEDCEALAKRLGWTVVNLYVDNDTSAFSTKPRKNYLRMLGDIEAGKINRVLAWHTDRLHRNNHELLAYIDLSVARKLPTQTVTAGPLDLSTANGRAAAITLGAWARAESEHKAERITAKHAQSAKDGLWRGGTRPFGYQADGITPHPTEADEVRSAYAAVLAGEALAAIMRDWNERGITTTTGRAWSYATLRQLLLRERNYGASVLRGEVVKTDAWPALVPEATWRAVRGVLKDSSRRTSGSNRGRWLLPGIGLCGVCDDGTTVKSATSRSRGTSHMIYRCRTHAHLGRRAEYVDAWVTSVVLARLRKDDARELLTAGDTPDGEALTIEAEATRTQIQDALDLWKKRLMSKAQYETTVAELQAELAVIEARMHDGDRTAVLGDLVEADDPEPVWESLSWAQKRAVVQVLCTVTIDAAGKGNARTFDPSTVRIEPRR